MRLLFIHRNHPDLVEAGHSLSSGDLMSTNFKKDTAEAISKWNPFEDSNFCQTEVVAEEEDLFGAEFDKIRQEGEPQLRLIDSIADLIGSSRNLSYFLI